MIISLLDIVMSIYQNVLIIYVLRKQFAQRKHSFVWEACFSIGPTILLRLVQYYHLPIPDSMILLSFFLYLKYTSEERPLICLFWVIVDAFLFTGTLSLISSLFEIQIGINGEVLKADEDVQIVYCFAGNSAITAVLCLAARFRGAHSSVRQNGMFLYLLMLFLCFCISECLFLARVSNETVPALIIGSICVFLVMILIVILYERMIEAARRRKMDEMSAKTERLVSEHLDELETVYKGMLAQQHDLRHRIAVVEEILSSSDIREEQRREAMSLLDKERSSAYFATGSIAVDAILKSKSLVMEHAGITFELTDYPLIPLPIPEREFCMLLGNMLDNAIEGVMRLPISSVSRHIKLSFTKVYNMLFVSCYNDANPSCIRQNGSGFISTKKDPGLHGFGVENMKKNVTKFGGTIEFEDVDNQFRVEIMLGGDSPC